MIGYSPIKFFFSLKKALFRLGIKFWPMGLIFILFFLFLAEAHSCQVIQELQAMGSEP